MNMPIPPAATDPSASECAARAQSASRCDVAILGGGLAGLTLAVQLKQRDPSVAVSVLERRAHPVREAAF
jgi:monoamine oxidase